MGTITIKVEGSFPNSPFSAIFSGEDGGHQLALHRAVSWLQAQMPESIVLDHALHGKGQEPIAGYGRMHPVEAKPGRAMEGTCGACGATFPSPHETDCSSRFR